MNKKNRKNAIMAGSLAGVLALTGAFAYLTDRDSATNKFTVGDVDIELQEPNWDEADAQDIWAGKVITKDPQIENKGDNESYVYLEVTVPKATVVTTDNDGNVLNGGVAEYQDLFKYATNAGWTQIGEEIDSGAGADGTGTVKRLYCYDTALAAADLTDPDNPVYDVTDTPLFSEVTFVNLKDNHGYGADGTEQQIPSDVEQDIVINAYAIQSNFGAGGAGDVKTPQEAWELYATQNQVADDFTPAP